MHVRLHAMNNNTACHRCSDGFAQLNLLFKGTHTRRLPLGCYFYVYTYSQKLTTKNNKVTFRFTYTEKAKATYGGREKKSLVFSTPLVSLPPSFSPSSRTAPLRLSYRFSNLYLRPKLVPSPPLPSPSLSSSSIVSRAAPPPETQLHSLEHKTVEHVTHNPASPPLSNICIFQFNLHALGASTFILPRSQSPVSARTVPNYRSEKFPPIFPFSCSLRGCVRTNADDRHLFTLEL